MWTSLKRTLLLLTASVCLISGYAFRIVLTSNLAAATDYCTSEACLNARKEEAEKTKAAENASNTAAEHQSAVSRLNQEINTKSAQINVAINKIASLKQEINTKISELTEQKTALAEVLNDLNHDKNTDLILLIASSKNITDLTEKQARESSIKNQIAAYAEKIEQTKQELEQEKQNQEIIEAGLKNEQAEIAQMRNEQASLQAKYENDAAAYESAAEEARRIQADEIAKAIAAASRAAGGRAVVSGGFDSYPYAGQCPGINWRYTGYVQTAYGGALCECTSYAGWKAQEYWGYSIPWAADAKGWGYYATVYGLRFDSTPAPHTIGVQYAGIWGHVVWIEHVNSDGTVDVSEYNNTYSSGGPEASFGYQTGVPASAYYYIHFD